MSKRITAFILAVVMVMCLVPAVNVYAAKISLAADGSIDGPEGVTWTGKDLKAKFTVKCAGKTLKEGTDYKIEYDYPSGNIPGNYCHAYAVGMGNYEDSLEYPFLILFTDVSLKHNFREHVYWGSYNKYMTGYTGSDLGKFGVGDNITRGQMVTALWRYADKPNPKSSKQMFEDVPKTHNFYKAIQWAAEEGITGGYTINGKKYFKPKDNCTRGQFVTFLWRYHGKPGSDNIDTPAFSDIPKDHKYYAAIQWAAGNEITGGYKDGTFKSNKESTRGQAITFLHRYNEAYNPDGDPWPEPEYY